MTRNCVNYNIISDNRRCSSCGIYATGTRFYVQVTTVPYRAVPYRTVSYTVRSTTDTVPNLFFTYYHKHCRFRNHLSYAKYFFSFIIAVVYHTLSEIYSYCISSYCICEVLVNLSGACYGKVAIVCSSLYPILPCTT